MGGKREEIIKGKTTKEELVKDVQSIRFHQSGGEVHFHADAEKLKVAVPVPVWMKAWEKLKNPQESYQTFEYGDEKNNSFLSIAIGYKEGEEGKVTMDTSIIVLPYDATDPIFQALKRFSDEK